MSDFNCVLVANRGEIAVRILRSARDLGYQTVAVYSEADAEAPHVGLADQAICIGPAPVKASYLNAGAILDAARRSGAEAVHPGYGFLSENADFARACVDAGLVFIGPSPEAIELMGNKAAAKRRMLAAGVPCVPGFQEAQADDAALLAAAEEIGFPLMVKAAAGGGGRGMRLVEAAGELSSALASARSEAQNAFGSGELILERALRRPRHVEVQVFGDRHGNHIHLGERDCSVQRRHQKVVEEAPCPVMTPALRRTMGEAAVAAARSIDYVGAGTVEFLLDGDGSFYFLEMNTRLQVEHPVTECVTGLDLVALQFEVAAGGRLPLGQEDIQLQGHAIEVRLYAEDTSADFLPASGTALAWKPPSGAGIRVDHGLAAGQIVSPFYDPMLAKLIACGPDRRTARRRLLRALRETVIFGLPTNREFLVELLADPAFAGGEATTAFISERFPDGQSVRPADGQLLSTAALLQYREDARRCTDKRIAAGRALAGFRSGRELGRPYACGEGDARSEFTVIPLDDGSYSVSSAQESRHFRIVAESAGQIRLDCEGWQFTVDFAFPGPGEIELQVAGQQRRVLNRLADATASDEQGGSGVVLAPMHGHVLHLRVAEGDTVTAGDEVAVMEAMKMEHRLTAAVSGVVSAVLCAEGQQLAAGAPLLEIDAADA